MNECIVKEPNIPGNECSPPSSPSRAETGLFLQQLFKAHPHTSLLTETESFWWRTPLLDGLDIQASQHVFRHLQHVSRFFTVVLENGDKCEQNSSSQTSGYLTGFVRPSDSHTWIMLNICSI